MGTTSHPRETDLALLAGGEAGRAQRFLLDRHVQTCADCQQKVAEYQELRSHLADSELPDVNWSFLAAEMRANIRLGLEAGACVRSAHGARRWFKLDGLRFDSSHPRFAFALASLVLLLVTGFFLRDIRPRYGAARVPVDTTPVLRSTGSGVEFRTGETSLILLNQPGNTTNQTVSARGDIGSRMIDGGSVTINSVYLQ